MGLSLFVDRDRQPFHLSRERLALDAEDEGCLGLIAGGRTEDGGDVTSL